MIYKVQLICNHPPHQCRCRHNIATEVNQEDLTANLIKYNPSLLKYLGRTTTRLNVETAQVPRKEEIAHEKQEDRGEKPYRSIVEEKGLNFIYREPVNQRPTSPKIVKKQSEPILLREQTKPVIQQQQSKNNLQDNNPKHPSPSKNQKQLRNYHKDLKNQSRYLSNTAFRKYFDRQCFQNYGNQNIHHKGDGFVYGNYLKTYNINPHSGQNMPINEQTFYHALVTASPEKYALQTQEVQLSHTSPHKGMEKQTTALENHSLEKSKINVEKMLEDNLKHSKLQKKYDHLKLKGKAEPTKIIKNSTVGFKSEGKLKPNTNNYISSQNIDSRYSPNVLQLQSKKAIIVPPSGKNSNINSNLAQQQQMRYQQSTQKQMKRTESIVIQGETNLAEHTAHKLECNHREGEKSTECQCCLNQMKALILTLAESDPDLASRIVNSAKKATLYKNYALNNYETASMNPHNYRRSDGRLNIYEH